MWTACESVPGLVPTWIRTGFWTGLRLVLGKTRTDPALLCLDVHFVVFFLTLPPTNQHFNPLTLFDFLQPLYLSAPSQKQKGIFFSSSDKHPLAQPLLH